MAGKRPDLSAIFRPTEPGPAKTPDQAPGKPTAAPAPDPRQQPARDRITAVSVGLRESEVAELASIAAGLGVTRNGLMAWVLRWFLEEHRAGRVTVPVTHETTAHLQRL